MPIRYSLPKSSIDDRESGTPQEMSEESQHGEALSEQLSERAIGSLTDESYNDGFGPDFAAISLSRLPETW